MPLWQKKKLWFRRAKTLVTNWCVTKQATRTVPIHTSQPHSASQGSVLWNRDPLGHSVSPGFLSKAEPKGTKLHSCLIYLERSSDFRCWSSVVISLFENTDFHITSISFHSCIYSFILQKGWHWLCAMQTMQGTVGDRYHEETYSLDREVRMHINH